MSSLWNNINGMQEVNIVNPRLTHIRHRNPIEKCTIDGYLLSIG